MSRSRGLRNLLRTAPTFRLKRVVTVLAALTVACWGLIFGVEQVAYSQNGAVSQGGHVQYPSTTGSILTFAVLGSDARSGPPDTGGGCDADHIISFNTTTMKGSIINIPRDTYLQGHKLTDICRASGFQAGVDALKAYTGLPIQYWGVTDFTNFSHAMDEVGGLPIHVYTRLYNPPDTGANYQPGDYHFLGGDLLAFARERDTAPGGDFGRTTDQAQEIISGLRDFTSIGDLSNLFSLIRIARQHIAFNVPLPVLIQWGMIARQVKSSNIQSCTLQGTGQMIGGADVEIPAPTNNAIFAQVKIDATIPAGAQCFSAPQVPGPSINWEIPAASN